MHIGEILKERTIILRGADPVTQHGFVQVPTVILTAKDITGNAKLVYALLGGTHEVDHLQPQMQRQVAILEDGPDADGEGLATGVALAQARAGSFAVQAADPLPLAAMRADGAARPEVAFDVLESGVFVLKGRGGKDRISHDNLLRPQVVS
jgi:hypothetical protein